MSSGASTESTFRPWHFFVLVALLVATAGVFLSRGAGPAHVILITLIIGGAALVGAAVYRTLGPLANPEPAEHLQTAAGRTRAALEQEKTHVLRSIKELEFDRAMDKVSPEDYEAMVARLRTRAVRLIRQLDGEGGYRELIERELASRLGRAAAARRTASPGESSAIAENVTPGPRAPITIGTAHADTAAGPDAPDVSESPACIECGTVNDRDARFCKRCGMKIVTAVLLLAALLVPSLGLAQPNLRMMAGIPRPDGTLGDGVVTVRVVRQALANNVIGQPVDLVAGTESVASAMTDGEGRATFDDLSAGTTVRAVTMVDGERLESDPFPAPGRGGVAVMLVAGLDLVSEPEAQVGTVSLGPESRVVIEMRDDVLQVFYVFDIVNLSPYPVTPPEPVIFDLPTGASGAGALDSSSAQVVVRGDRVTVTPPFAPGVTPMVVGYAMPHSSARLTIAQQLPVALGAANVLVQRVGPMGLESPQLANQQERVLQGMPYLVAAGPAIGANGVLSLTLTGLPHRSGTPRTVAAVLCAIIVVVGVWLAISGPPEGGRTQRGRQRQQLEGRREKAFAELLRLEDERHQGAVAPEVYDRRRRSLIGQLERVYTALDEATDGGGGARVA